MFEVKPHRVEKKESSTETDEGLGSSGKRYGSGSLGSGSLYLSDSQDWALSPGCSPDEAPGPHSAAVSPSLADETFRYMTYLALDPSSYPLPNSGNISKVLSADRVEQMTRTYNDIEMVTHLLSERDRDLELAARIGQSLLQRNNLLQERNEAVEEQLNQAIDQVNQLQHELAKKDELLRMVASASEESESDSSCSTPHPLLQRAPGGGASTAAAAAATTALGQLEALQGKLEELEEENQALRSEASHLKTETFCYEEKEQRLVNDCVKELRESSSQVLSLADELSQKGEEVLRHQEEIAQLLSQIVELQHRVKELALEKEELRIHLQASKEAQRQLTAELNELTERNAECLGMLHESQEEVKDLRSKSNTTGGLRRHLSYGLYPMDSLAAEIEGTMRKELSVDEETIFQDQRTSQRRVFQTVRSVNTLTARAASSSPIPGSGLSPLVMTAQPFLSAQGDDHRPVPRPPGPPAGDHLSDAIRRLSLRRHNFLCERKFFQAERQRKMEAFGGGAGLEEGEGGASGAGSPAGSGRSSCSNLSELSAASGVFKSFLPERLQIVKPMEGSLTLHHWQQLAQPHLATLLDSRPGVVTKGFRPLSHDRDPPADGPPSSYRLDDPEEEDEEEGGRGHSGGAEKGSTERGKPVEKDEDEEEGEEEEEEGGIVFEVRVSSTPEDRRERPRLPGSPLPSATDLRSPLFRPLAAVGAVSYASALRAEPAPGSAHVSAHVPGSPCAVQPVAAGTAPTSDAAPSPVRPEGAAVASAGAAVASAGAPAVLSSVQHPGKCQSSTYSTYTVTTCRILHPNDITQVTSSSQPMWSVAPPDPPSSLRTGPSTPVTPCRLNLGGSSCFPPRRPPAPPPAAAGLAKLVLERGISASARPAPSLHPRRRPAPLLPQGPAGAPPPPGTAGDRRPALALDNFLASRPAELFLQDVYGLNLGRAPPHPDLPSPRPDAPPPKGGGGGGGPPDPVSVGLVERLCRLGFGRVLQGPADPPPPSTFVVAAGGGSLLAGLRRNQSLPVMMGAAPVLARPRPPAPPTSLALPPPPWGDPKGQQRRGRLSSFTQPPSSGAGKH